MRWYKRKNAIFYYGVDPAPKSRIKNLRASDYSCGIYSLLAGSTNINIKWSIFREHNATFW